MTERRFIHCTLRWIILIKLRNLIDFSVGRFLVVKWLGYNISHSEECRSFYQKLLQMNELVQRCHLAHSRHNICRVISWWWLVYSPLRRILNEWSYITVSNEKIHQYANRASGRTIVSFKQGRSVHPNDYISNFQTSETSIVMRVPCAQGLSVRDMFIRRACYRQWIQLKSWNKVN